ncbi:MAG: hypothetical protein EXS35_01035 [Pedosphaera sp.]|nr:hypothetical protein [Pedosphaera sp.]
MRQVARSQRIGFIPFANCRPSSRSVALSYVWKSPVCLVLEVWQKPQDGQKLFLVLEADAITDCLSYDSIIQNGGRFVLAILRLWREME